MSGFDTHLGRDFSKYDNLDTEMLEDILRKDSQLPDSEKSDLDAIIHIMEVLEKRYNKASGGEFSNANAAWQEFNQYYRPFADEKSLYADEELIELPMAKKTHKKPMRRLTRVASVAAIIVAIMVFGTITADAFGFDLWGKIALWTKETFGYEDVASTCKENRSLKVIPAQLGELETMLNKYGVANAVLPGFIPEGYEVVDKQITELDQTVDFLLVLSNQIDSIRLRYTLYNSGNAECKHEKDDDNPDVYCSGENKYYIMTNSGKHYAVWSDEKVECSILITGKSSKELLIKIIDSI